MVSVVVGFRKISVSIGRGVELLIDQESLCYCSVQR